jgi:hypothetical protein
MPAVAKKWGWVQSCATNHPVATLNLSSAAVMSETELQTGLRVAWALPFLTLAAAIPMILVAAFDEGFKPCPSFNDVKSNYCKIGTGQGTKNPCENTYSHERYDTFCSQTMQPRVTTCCRVPCGQNHTTYFDADGNQADCYSQPFKHMPVAVGGLALLGIALFWLLANLCCCRTWPHPGTCSLNFILRGIRGTPRADNSGKASAQEATTNLPLGGGEAIPDTTDAHAHSHADGEEMQVV